MPWDIVVRDRALTAWWVRIGGSFPCAVAGNGRTGLRYASLLDR